MEDEVTIRKELSITLPVVVKEGIENHKRAAEYHEEAARHHYDAVMHHEYGDHEAASESTVKAHEFANLAMDAQKDDGIQNAMNG